MQEKKPQNVDFILRNVKSLINARNDSELAEFFGVKGGTVSAWRSRDSIDYALLITKCREMGWNLDEIIYGNSTNRKLTIVSNTNGSHKPAEKPQEPESQSENSLVRLILAKDEELKKLSEEIGSLKEQIKYLRKKHGYDDTNRAAEPS